MRVKIVTRDPVCALGAHVMAEQRLREVLQAHGDWIRRIDARLGDDASARGGADKRVTLQLSVRRLGQLRFEAVAAGYEAALSRVLRRARRALLESPELGARRPQRGPRLEHVW